MAGVCAICGKSVGFFSKWKIKGKVVVCYDCVEPIIKHKSMMMHLDYYSVDQIKFMLNHPEELASGLYCPAKYKFSNSEVIFDPVCKTMNTVTAGIAKSQPINYADIQRYEYQENGKAKGTYGKMIATAALGGIIFGGAGAIIGAMAQGRGTKEIIKSVSVVVVYKVGNNFENFEIKVFDKRFNDPIKKSSSTYNALLNESKKLMAALDDAMDMNKVQPVKQENVSVADELLKYKSLLESGLITKEEFDQQKALLLSRN